MAEGGGDVSALFTTAIEDISRGPPQAASTPISQTASRANPVGASTPDARGKLFRSKVQASDKPTGGRRVRKVGIGSSQLGNAFGPGEPVATLFQSPSSSDGGDFLTFSSGPGASRLTAAGFDPDKSAVFGAPQRASRARILNIMSEQTTFLYEQCLFPSSFIKLLESGKSLSRATIPYKFLDILTKLKADDKFAIECARLSYEDNGTTRSPQAVVEEFISNHDVTTLGHGVNLAIRQFVHWHQQVLSWTYEHDDHRRKVVFPHLIRALTVPILEQADGPLSASAFPIIANEFYSYHLSLKLARGHEEAFSRKLQAKSVDSVKATIVFSYVQYTFWQFLRLPDVRAGRIETLTASELLENAKTLSNAEWTKYSSENAGDIERLMDELPELETQINNIRIVEDYRESKSLKTGTFRGVNNRFSKAAEKKMAELIDADPAFLEVKNKIDAAAKSTPKRKTRKDAFSDVTVVAEQPRTEEEDDAEDEALAFADP